MVARTQDRRFGTFILTDAANGVTVESWKNRLLTKTAFKDRVRGDGAIATMQRYTGQEVTFGGKVTGLDTGITATNLDGLLAALTAGEDWLQFYDDRRIRARLTGSVKYDPVPGNPSIYQFSAKMRSRWPTWERPTAINDQFTPTGAGPHTLNLTADVGSAPVFPLITIGSAVSFSTETLTLTNLSTLEQFQLGGLSMNASQSIIIDMREGWLGDGAVTSIHPYYGGGKAFALSPGAATNLELAHTVGATADWTIDVDWFPAFWTI